MSQLEKIMLVALSLVYVLYLGFYLKDIRTTLEQISKKLPEKTE